VVDSLRRLREPAALVLLVVLALRLVLDVVGLAQVFGGGADAGQLSGGVPVAIGDGLTPVVLAVLVGTCVLWSPTRHARTLTVAATLLTGLTLALFVVAVVAVLSGRGSGDAATLASAVLALVVPLLVLVFLATLWRGQPRAASNAEPGDRPESLTASAVSEQSTPALAAGRDPETAPVWQPDQAAGAAWLTAGDAAAGAAATRWGTPGDAGGWQPQPDRIQPDRSQQDRSPSTDPTRPEGRPGA
jgi:hypothetical protein